ncbi:Molybdopterin dehydrogenase, FAD-binding protein, partial [Corchorus capsularis]
MGVQSQLLRELETARMVSILFRKDLLVSMLPNVAFVLPECVSLFSALVNAEKDTNRPQPRPGFSKLTVGEAEKAISGNLCRCTGYRPIADVCKSFATDVDMEDLGFNSFWRKGETDQVKLSKLPLYNPNNNNASSRFPEFLNKENKRGANLMSCQGHQWYSPASLEQLQRLLMQDQNGANYNDQTSVKIIVGNTGMGYYKELEHYIDKYIDLRYIPELSIIRKDQTGVEIGAAVTIAKAIEALKEENEVGFQFHQESKTVFRKIAAHLEKIASRFVRNSGSVGGNLMMAQRKHFPSDIATILLPVGTIMNLMTGQKLEKLPLEEFLERPPLDYKSVLLSIKIPCWESRQDISSENDTNLLYETYRAAPRPLGNALPYLNAAFLAEFLSPLIYSPAEISGDCVNGIMLKDSKIEPNSDQSGEIQLPTLLTSGKQVIQSSKEYHPVGEPVTKAGATLQAS